MVVVVVVVVVALLDFKVNFLGVPFFAISVAVVVVNCVVLDAFSALEQGGIMMYYEINLLVIAVASISSDQCLLCVAGCVVFSSSCDR